MIKSSLEDIENLKDISNSVLPINKLKLFKDTLAEMFPPGNLWNIGLKMSYEQTNIFTNDFIKSMIGEMKNVNE